ncbi:MAG: ParB/RepB/Spo0J family partition protein [Pseudomonadota bacterium]|nr:ParB/RepB/Spo0J family partition protein [Pseudomonadota bacterium]
MASAAKTIAPPAGEVLALSPHDIAVGDRLGAFWPDKAAALGQMMAEDGQIVPIIVRASGPRASSAWTLVAGHHRLEGAKIAGLAVIDALAIETGADTLKIEAMENAARPARSPLERASFVRAIADAAEARLKDQHGDLSQQEVAIRARWAEMRAKAPGVERDDDLNDAEADHTRVNFPHVYGWRAEVAAAIGLSVESVKKDLALHRAIIAPFPQLWRALATHPVVGDNASALHKIAGIKDEGSRRDLIEGLIAAPDMTLDQALEGLGLSRPAAPAATGATKFMNGTTSNLARLSAGDQARIAPEIVKTMKPSALLALRTALDARIQEEGIEA